MIYRVIPSELEKNNIKFNHLMGLELSTNVPSRFFHVRFEYEGQTYFIPLENLELVEGSEE